MNPTGCICQKQDLCSHHLHQSNRQYNITHGISFIIMHTSLHAHNRHIPDITKHKAPGMARHRRYRKSLDLMIIHRGLHAKLRRIITQTGPQYQCHFRHKICFRPHAAHTAHESFIFVAHLFSLFFAITYRISLTNSITESKIK